MSVVRLLFLNYHHYLLIQYCHNIFSLIIFREFLISGFGDDRVVFVLQRTLFMPVASSLIGVHLAEESVTGSWKPANRFGAIQRHTIYSKIGLLIFTFLGSCLEGLWLFYGKSKIEYISHSWYMPRESP